MEITKGKKFLYIGLVMLVILAYFGYTSFFKDSSNINIYKDGSIINEELQLNQEDSFSLPYNVLVPSIYLMPTDAEMISLEVKRVGELEGNIGKKVKVFFKDNEVEGTLLDIKNGKAYVKTDEGIYIVYPDAYVVESQDSTTKAFVEFNSKPSKVMLSYMTSGIKWSAEHKLFLFENGKARIETFANINNNDDKAYSGTLELVADSLGIGSRSYYNYDYENLYRSKGLEMAGMAQPVSEENYVVQERAEKTIKYKLGSREISAKSNKIIKVDESEVDYSRILEYSTSINSYDYGGSSEFTKLSNVIEFKAPYDLASGNVNVYGNTFEGKARIGNKAKDDNISLTLGTSFYVSGKTETLDYQTYANGKVVEKEVEITIKNNGDEEENIKVNVGMPYYAEWKVLESSESYEKTHQKLTYRFKISPGNEKKISLKVRIEYG